MKKESKGGMRSATMPKEHFQHNLQDNDVCREKYATEFGNPEDLLRANNGLANYAKKHKMKY